MSSLAYALLPLPRGADPFRFREGDRILEVSPHARGWILQIASLREGRLDLDNIGALQALLDADPSNAEIALLIRAIAGHGAVHVRRL